MIDYFYLSIYKVFSLFIKTLPESWLDNGIQALARFAYFASAKRRRVIHANLEVCFPDMQEKEKKSIGIHSYQNLLHGIAGFIKREGQSKEEILKNIHFENREILDDLLKQEKKVILVTAHFGTWEILPSAIALGFDIPLSTVGRELDSKLMQKYLKVGREQAGVELINKRGALKGMIKAMGKGRILGLLVDQSLSKSLSVDVDFFGKRVTHTPSVSILARKFDAQIVPIYITSDDFRHHTVTCYPPIMIDKNVDKEEDIKRLNQAQASILESVIKNHTSEWFWSHKRFKVYDKEIYT